MKKLALLAIVTMFLIGACSVAKHNETSVMKADYGILRLVGNAEGRTFSLDGNVINLDIKKQVNNIELKTGTYTLEISNNGKVVLAQRLFITNGQANEVKIP
jgi:hypothetical protein